LSGCKSQYEKVEAAIRDAKWPYDNGDDPSFYVTRQHGGPLTWGVCRQDLRTQIDDGSIVVFFSFTPLKGGKVSYRLCAVATVAEKLDHRAVDRDRRFSRFRDFYINRMITRKNGWWCYDETDRPASVRHKDWFWRMAADRSSTRQKFNTDFAWIYEGEKFRESDIASGRLHLAKNYVVFSTRPEESFISWDPPEVAIAVKGEREEWAKTHRKLEELTVGKARLWHPGGRDYLRAANRSNCNVHRQLGFDMPTEDTLR